MASSLHRDRLAWACPRHQPLQPTVSPATSRYSCAVERERDGFQCLQLSCSNLMPRRRRCWSALRWPGGGAAGSATELRRRPALLSRAGERSNGSTTPGAVCSCGQQERRVERVGPLALPSAESSLGRPGSERLPADGPLARVASLPANMAATPETLSPHLLEASIPDEFKDASTSLAVGWTDVKTCPAPFCGTSDCAGTLEASGQTAPAVAPARTASCSSATTRRPPRSETWNACHITNSHIFVAVRSQSHPPCARGRYQQGAAPYLWALAAPVIASVAFSDRPGTFEVSGPSPQFVVSVTTQ